MMWLCALHASSFHIHHRPVSVRSAAPQRSTPLVLTVLSRRDVLTSVDMQGCAYQPPAYRKYLGAHGGLPRGVITVLRRTRASLGTVRTRTVARRSSLPCRW